jgi:hypothetical protein
MLKKNPSYAADFMLMDLPSQFNYMFSEDGLDFSNPSPTSMFLHEWFHFIHNISTVNGVYAFFSMLQMWSHFRNTIDVQGRSASERTLSEDAIDEINRVFQLRMAGRRKRDVPASLHQKTDMSSTIDSFRRVSTFITADPLRGYEEVTTIKCKLRLEDNIEEIEIGVVEILEGVAWMLEGKYLLSEGQFPTPIEIAPYQLIKKLVAHCLTDIDDDVVIACGLASLQAIDPPKALCDLLEVLPDKSPDERMQFLARQTQTMLSYQRETLEKVFNDMASRFPVDEPMGLAVKNLLRQMQDNLAIRRFQPFFEFDLIRLAKDDPEHLKSVISTFTCCRILVRSSGPDDQIGRDTMYKYGFSDANGDELMFGMQKLHAALHFVLLHMSEEGLSTTEDLTVGSSRRECPFYTSCTYLLRNDRPEICKSEPWVSLSIPTDPLEHCWYRSAVRSTRPPLEEFGVHDDSNRL